MLRTKKTYVILSIFLLALFVFAYGCGQKRAERAKRDDRVIARINNYKLMASDIKEAASIALVKQKEQLLDMLISKEVLLQEAQRLNLDKEKSFMKEIEGYWEQALLKSLVSKKIKEMSGNLAVTGREIADEYSRMRRRVLAELIVFPDRGSAQRFLQAGAVSGVGAGAASAQAKQEWYESGDLPPILEDALFAMKQEGLSAPIEYNNSWVVLRFVSEEEVKAAPLEELKARIAENIIRIKKQKLLEDWSAELRRKTTIKIDKEALKGIDLS